MKRSCEAEGVDMVPLTTAVKRAGAVAIEVHVGSLAVADLQEARMLEAAAAEGGCGVRPTVAVHVHAGCGHSVVRSLRDAGELDAIFHREAGGTGVEQTKHSHQATTAIRG